MRRKDREITDSKRIEEILNGAKYLHLGLFDDAYPYVVPLHYGYSFDGDNLTFYMHSAKEGHKLDLIHKNPCVCIELDCDARLISGGDIACKYGSSFASVIGRGRAVIINDVSEKIAGLKLLMNNQTGRDFDISEAMAAGVAVIKVEIDEFSAKGRDFPTS